MGQNVKYPTPSQAEGERLEGNTDPAEAEYPAMWRTRPSQAERERLAEHSEN
ncbi:hypothetical protein ACWD4L_17840 [Streptomyces sp. NPDC002596]|uniref:hypothetical protein n=1 Tax=unclassified Streptomyces TaxID=2593676 RepID=UPI0035E32308